MKNLVLIALFALFGSILLNAQNDGPSWTSPSREHNFYDIQADFNKYWEGKNITPEMPRQDRAGWKQFRRWEWFWEQRVAPSDGVFPPRGHVFLEYMKLRDNKNNGKQNYKQSTTWSHIGPFTAPGGYEGIGRLNSIIEDPNYNGTSNRILWAAGASGGIWKSTDAGTSWTTNTDDLSVLGIADIVIDPNNTNIMYAATGDGDAYDTYSIGVIKSTNAGQTWELTGFQLQVTEQKVCRRMIISHSNSNVLFVATTGGLYRTTNAGTTWSQVQSGSFYDVKMHLTNANFVYATTGNTFYRSTNGGASFSTVTGLASSSSRYALAVSPHSPGYVYVLSTNSSGGYNGLFRSIDSGATFSSRSTTPNILNSSSNGSGTGGQGWYDLALTVDPNNAEIVYVGGINIWKSINGGTTWTLKSYWYNISGVAEVHADQHMLYFGGTSNRLYAAHDGGLDVSTNGGDTWSYKSAGLHITQFYKIATSQTNAFHVLCGAQDNSSFLRTQNSFGMTRATGDGMDQAINPSNGNIMFTSSYYGNFYRSTNAGSSWSAITKPADDGAWVTPIEIDPINHTTIYTAYKNIWKSTNNGSNWTQISTFSNSLSLTSLHISKADPNYIYAGRSSSMWRTTDGGANWTVIPIPSSGLTSIATNHTNPDEVWITLSGYNASNKVFRSMNGGGNWLNMTGNLPNVPCNVIIYQPGVDDRMWVGTDIGVWYRGSTNTEWIAFNDGLPNVICNDLDIYTAGNKLRVGTYGRGLWEVELPSLPNLPPTLVSPANYEINIPTNTRLSWNQTVNALTYRVQVSTNNNFFASNLVSNTIVNTLYKDITGLTFNIQYYWRVMAMSATDTSDWSEVRSFTVRPVLLVPELFSPEANENIASDSIQFFWKYDYMATHYRIQVAENNNFTNLHSTLVTADTSIWIGSLPLSNEYFWRVQAINGSDTTDWSPSRKFTNELIYEITIGTGTASSSFPFYTYYHDASSFFLYRSPEILSAGGMPGYIHSLSFNILGINSSLQPMNDFKIFMQNTSLANVTAPVSSNWTLVYSASSFTPTDVGWKEFALNTPFLFNGSDNLLIKVCFNNSSFSDFTSVYATSISGTTHCRYADNGATDGCVVDPTSISTPARPNIKILMTAAFMPPILISPANSTSDMPINNVLEWSNVANAVSYDLQVSTNNAFTSFVINTNETSPSKSISGLSYFTDYFWRVRAISSSDTSDWSNVFTFKTRPAVYSPLLISPLNNASLVQTSMNFIWRNDTEATGYRIQISADNTFSNLITNTIVSDTTFTKHGISLGSSYYWKVRAISPNGLSDWSEVRVFSTTQMNDIIIGDGTLISNFPFYTYYHDASSFFLYRSPEIISAGGSSGQISSIGFNITSVNSSNQPMNSFKIFMQNTTMANVTAPVDTGWTLVYSVNSFTPTQTGWVSFQFPTPFNYDASNNLLVKVCFNNSTYTTFSNVAATAVTGTTHCRYDDNGAVDGCTVNPALILTPSRPNIKLGMVTSLPFEAVQLLSPADNSLDMPISNTLVWKVPILAEQYRVQVSEIETFAGVLVNSLVSDTSFQLSGLSYNTTYYWKVRPVALGQNGPWSEIYSFTTESGIATQNIPLTSGWNMISANVTPSNTQMGNVISPISSNMQLIKNAFGQLYAPPFQTSLNTWNISHAYQIRMNTATLLQLNGITINPASTPINFTSIGTYWLPYYRSSSMATATALATISGKYLQIKNMYGQVYQPPFFYTLQNLQPNDGYIIRMTQTGSLTYPANNVIKASSDNNDKLIEPSVFVRERNITGKTAVIAMDLKNIELGDEIGVFTREGLLVGSSVWQEGMRGVVVWGDDEFTNEKDGAAEGDELILKVWGKSSGNISKVNNINISDMARESANYRLFYETDAVILLEGEVDKSKETLIFITPQPAIDELSIYINLAGSQKIGLKIYNQNGKLIGNFPADLSAGLNKINISELASGVYQLIINIDGKQYFEKFVVVK